MISEELSEDLFIIAEIARDRPYDFTHGEMIASLRKYHVDHGRPDIGLQRASDAVFAAEYIN